MTDRRKRIEELETRLEATSSERHLASRRRFDISLFMFRGNYADFERVIGEAKQLAASGKLLSDRRLRKNALSHIVRVTHNFVASAQTLIDHTRRYSKELVGEGPEIEEYQSMIDVEFAKDPLTQFVRRLRQYLQHYQALALAMSTSVAPDMSGFDAIFYLLKDDLLAFDDWNAPAKEFIRRSGESVDISKVVKDYHDKVMRFFEWFREFQISVIERIHDETDHLKDELTLLRVEENIETSTLRNRSKETATKDEIFHSIFLQSELELLDNHPSDPEARAELAIQLLEEFQEVPSRLSEKIRDWYKEFGRDFM